MDLYNILITLITVGVNGAIAVKTGRIIYREKRRVSAEIERAKSEKDLVHAERTSLRKTKWEAALAARMHAEVRRQDLLEIETLLSEVHARSPTTGVERALNSVVVQRQNSEETKNYDGATKWASMCLTEVRSLTA